MFDVRIPLYKVMINDQKYMITVDYNQSLEKTLAIYLPTSIDKNITDLNFPWKGDKNKVPREVCLLSIVCTNDWRSTSVDSNRAFEKMGERNLRPVDLRELIALDQQHADLDRSKPIVALGSTWRQPAGERIVFVPYLCTPDFSHRGFALTKYVGGFTDHWQFAAVSK